MKTSDQGLRLILEREGKSLKAYRDSVGVWTIGVGHTGPEVHEGLVWTDNQVMEALKADVARFERAILSSVSVPLKQHQFDALVSFAFNVGEGAFTSSTMLKKINAGDMDAAAKEFDRWHIPAEITSRRNAEREQFKGTAFEPRIHEDTVA